MQLCWLRNKMLSVHFFLHITMYMIGAANKTNSTHVVTHTRTLRCNYAGSGTNAAIKAVFLAFFSTYYDVHDRIRWCSWPIACTVSVLKNFREEVRAVGERALEVHQKIPAKEYLICSQFGKGQQSLVTDHLFKKWTLTPMELGSTLTV